MRGRRLLLAGALVVGLSACSEGCVDAGTPTPGNGKGREGWYRVTDPLTNQQFNCFWWSLSDSTAMWCHELERTTDG